MDIRQKQRLRAKAINLKEFQKRSLNDGLFLLMPLNGQQYIKLGSKECQKRILPVSRGLNLSPRSIDRFCPKNWNRGTPGSLLGRH